jgi:hypothetical protein
VGGGVLDGEAQQRLALGSDRIAVGWRLERLDWRTALSRPRVILHVPRKKPSQVKHRSILKNRVHASLIAFGHQVPMADLFGAWPGQRSS